MQAQLVYEALLVVHHHVSGKKVAKAGFTFLESTGLPQLCLRMLWGNFNTQLLDLFV
jgi:hypothetical protein